MTRNKILISTAAAGSMAILAISPVFASSTVDVSTLISDADATTIAGYLGHGDLSLHNIFTKIKGDGKTAPDFHAAADGKGPTFTVYSASYRLNGITQTDIIGGYDPQSWASLTDGPYSFKYASTDADRTAFIFNLTFDKVLPENLTSALVGNTGQYQTFDLSSYGPNFGGGYDIGVYGDLESGYANSFSYTPTSGGENVIGHGTNIDGISYNAIETFTFSPLGGTITPEPNQTASFGLGAFALAGLAAFARKRRTANASA